MQMEALVMIHHQRILDVIPVESDGILADGRGERKLEHTDLVVIDIDIRKDILHHRVQDFTRLYEVVDTRRVHAFDDDLLVMRFLPVDLLRDRLIDRYGENQFVVIRTRLHLIDEPLFLFVFRVLHHLLRDLVEGQRQLLVFVILVEVMVVEVGFLLGLDDLLHHLHRRVVLPTVSSAFRFHRHFLQDRIICFHADGIMTFHVVVDHDDSRHISHGTECQGPSVMAFNAEPSLDI